MELLIKSTSIADVVALIVSAPKRGRGRPAIGTSKGAKYAAIASRGSVQAAQVAASGRREGPSAP